jgi:carbohydrate-selective porin OprB
MALHLATPTVSAGVLSLGPRYEPIIVAWQPQQPPLQENQAAEEPAEEPSQEPERTDKPASQQETDAAPREHALPKAFLGGVPEEIGEIRQDLLDRGITLRLFFNDQFQAVLRGGRSTSSGRNAGSTDMFFIFDLDKLKVLDNSEFLIHFQANWGLGVNGTTGTLFQVNDDADGSLGGHIAQAWYRVYFWDARVSLKIGYLDYQTIVDRNAFANSEDIQFWNQTLDNNPLVPLNIGLGAALTIHPNEWYTLILGAGDARNRPYSAGFDTTFDSDAIFVAYLENGFHFKLPSDRGPLAGNYRFGVFYDPRTKTEYSTRLVTSNQSGDYGFYISADQVIFRESEEDNQGLGLFARFGYRDPDVNALSTFYSGGISYTGLIDGRDEDVLGLGYSFVRSSAKFREAIDNNFTDESVYELYYAIKVCPNFVVTPDVQYVVNPGATGALSDMIVAGVRLRLSL